MCTQKVHETGSFSSLLCKPNVSENIWVGVCECYVLSIISKEKHSELFIPTLDIIVILYSLSVFLSVQYTLERHRSHDNI